MARFLLAVLGIFLTFCIVNAEVPLQPTLQSVKKATSIRGLLVRQTTCDVGWGFCSSTGSCCPIGGKCCSDGNCCDVGQYCVLGTNGIIGCCPNGETCSGPAPPSTDSDTTIFVSTSTTRSTFITTPTLTPTPTFSSFTQTTFSSPRSSSRTTSSVSAFTGSPTFYTPRSTPIADAGFTNVFVAGDDTDITWSTNDWTTSGSSCDTTKQCRRTTGFSSFTYMASSSSSGSSLYLDISYDNTDFEIFIDGQESNVIGINVATCSFYSIGHLPTSKNDINITIVVSGPLRSGRRQIGSDNFSFEFNGFMIGQSTLKKVGAGSQNGPTAMIVVSTLAVVMLGFISWL